MIRYGYRRQCGGLDESLRTKKYISLEQFNKFLREYHFYAYDERCRQYLFILKDIKNKLNCFKNKNWQEYVDRTWLFIEV